VLDRLRARVEERGLRRCRERRRLAEPLRQRDVDLVGDDGEAGVREPPRLLLDRGDDTRMGVTDREAADTAGEVEERVPVDVGEGRAARLLDDDRKRDREGVGDDELLAGEDLARARAWNLGAELDRASRGHGPTIAKPPAVESP